MQLTLQIDLTMNEDELIQSLHELDRLHETNDLPNVCVSQLETLATARRRSRAVRVSALGLVLFAVGMGVWFQFRTTTPVENGRVENDLAVVQENTNAVTQESDVEQLLRDSEKLLRETNEYLANVLEADLGGSAFVDEASIVSFAIAEHYLSVGFVEESRREMESLKRVLPNSLGGREAARKLAAWDASENQNSLKTPVGEGV